MEPEQLQLGFLKILKGSYMEELIPDCDLLYSAAPPYEVLQTKWLSYGDVLELKDIEEMTEVHYNSRQFTCTLKELEKEFNTPYEMFSFMAGYYEQKLSFWYQPQPYYQIRDPLENNPGKIGKIWNI